jgi:anaerobic magnesium-protoporphyrin IX monomethyl ester cyclase
MKYRFRSPQSVMEEIKDLQKRYGVNYILFHDELTFFSKKYAQDFAKEIIDKSLQFYWAACCRGDLFQQDEDVVIIEELRKAGCLGLAFSLESADPQILKSMNKHLMVEQFSRQVELCRKAGMNVWTSLVLGYPQETPETIKKTMDVCIENKIYPSAGYLLPQPGSPIYNRAIKEGFIKDEEEYLLKMGDRQDLRLNMTKMSDEEFESRVREGLKRCSEAIGIGLKDEELIKTLFYRSTTSDLRDN